MSVMNASRRLIRVLAAATALGVGTLALTACGSATGERQAPDGKVNVVASFFPLQFLAQQIGGGHVEVETLTKPGTEPHDLELSPQETGRLTDTDLVVYLRGLQPAVDEAVQQAEPRHVADAASYTALEKHGEDVHGERKSLRHHAVPSGSAHGADPHVWLDPVRYGQIAKGVGKALAESDPSHKKDYEKNTLALRKRLRSLDEDFERALRRKKTDTFITTHAAFGYLAERYGLHEAAVTGVDPESEPSGARIKKLHSTAKAGHVDTVFFESSASDKTARTLAHDLNLRTGVLSPLESVRKGQDYFSVMHQNLISLQTALGAT
jgi:zinc transport system substrate-binding protein